MWCNAPMGKGVLKTMKRKFSGLTLRDAMQMVPAEDLLSWTLDAPSRLPSPVLPVIFERFASFELFASEAAKVMLIDTLLAEIVPGHPRLKVWKSAPLEAETIAGVVDYLIAPKRAYVETPLLCAIEAKRDDFEKGQVQCIAEMATCRENNLRDGQNIDVHGIVSSGQVWVFYKLTTNREVFVSGLFTTDELPKLLGALDFVCAACAQNVPQPL